MLKEELKKTTARLFKEYGFTIQGKYYYLNLDDLSIIAVLDPRYGDYVLCYNFSLNAIHSEKDRKKGDPFTAYDSLLIDTCDMFGNKFINPDSLTVVDFEKDIRERLIRYIDPFKSNYIEHILSYSSSEKGNAPDSIILCKEIRNYLEDLQS